MRLHSTMLTFAEVACAGDEISCLSYLTMEIYRTRYTHAQMRPRAEISVEGETTPINLKGRSQTSVYQS